MPVGVEVGPPPVPAVAEQWGGEQKAGDKEQWIPPPQSPQRTPSRVGVLLTDLVTSPWQENLNSWLRSSLTAVNRAEATVHAVVPTYFVVTSALAAFVLGVIASAFCLLRGPRNASRLRNGSANSKSRTVGDDYERATACDAEWDDDCHKSTADQGTVTSFKRADNDALNGGVAVACCDEHDHRKSLCPPLPTAKGWSSRIRANQRFRSFSTGSTSCTLYSAAAHDSTSDEQEDEDLAETEIMQDER